MNISKDFGNFSVLCQDAHSINSYKKLTEREINEISKDLMDVKSGIQFVFSEMKKHKVVECDMGIGLRLNNGENMYILKYTIYTKKNNPAIIVVNYFSEVTIDEYLDFMNECNDPKSGYKKSE